ncbi:MAG: tyrosine--tRNA ligase [Firmicutes bacterium]|nr:tyrosine--tRNA ligase [Bacillota bacterium]
MKFNSNAFGILQERGFVYLLSHPEETRKLLEKGPVTFYLGIDPTADDLHIGHFFALQIFKILQDCGHKGVLLIGGATAMIGDPSFKSDMRKLLTKEEVDRNSKEINGILHRFISLSGDNPAIVVNNADWIRQKDFIGFLREVGTHFNVAKMLAADCYKNRLHEGGLTFLEMGYMLMQAYDFVHLNDKYNCLMQIGGSDQWGNIVAGVELSRKMSNAKGQERPLMVGLCCPLLTKADGTKMGKTEKGVLWVSRDKTSAYDCFQYFTNVYDEDVEQLLRFFTMLPVAEIKDKCKTDIVGAKRLMAYEVTKKLHGEAEAKQAQETAKTLFSGGGADGDVPTQEISIGAGAKVVDVLALTSIVKSKREAREFIEAGAILIDNEKVVGVDSCLDKNKKEFLVKKGKKTFLKVVLKP